METGSASNTGGNIAKKFEKLALGSIKKNIVFNDVGWIIDCPTHKAERKAGKVCVALKDTTDPSSNKENEIILHDVPILGEWAGEIRTIENDITGSGITRTFQHGTQVAISYRAGNFNAPFVNGVFYNPHEKSPNENQQAVLEVPLDEDYYAIRLAGAKIGLNSKGQIDMKSVGFNGANKTVGIVIDPDAQTISIGGEEEYLAYEGFEKESRLEKRNSEEKTTLRVDVKNNLIELYTTDDRKILVGDKEKGIKIINSKDKKEINSVVINEKSITLSFAAGEPTFTLKENGDLEFTGRNVKFVCDKFNVEPNKGTGVIQLKHDLIKMDSSKTFLHKAAVMANNVVTAKDPVPGYGAPTAGVANTSGAFA